MAKAIHRKVSGSGEEGGNRIHGRPPIEKTKKKRVLMVDDEYLNRAAISRLLKSEGMQVQTAENAQKALELLGKEEFDVIVLDFDMPDMNGLELFWKMGENNKKNTIFYTSSEDESGKMEKTGRPRVGKKPELLILEIEKMEAKCS
ncbi:response regulator [Candidatus Micrarchaeota archaeon]|nr:response regulator [Candidatus Micrarchaeota archaeon]